MNKAVNPDALAPQERMAELGKLLAYFTRHLAFGFGIHRCVGNRLAEMPLRILWEEILPRFQVIEVVGPPQRVRSTFVRGFTHLPVRIAA